jgi:hypothetical protein
MHTRLVRGGASLIVLLVLALPCAARQDKGGKKVEYDELIARVKRSDASVDFGHLRTLATELDSYTAVSGGASRGAMNAALQAGDFKSALQLAQKDLDGNYLDIDAHIVAMVAADKLGDAERTAHHRYVAKGILDSIFKSGDGKTPETAFKVIAVNEEYAVVRVLGFQPSEQALHHAGGHDYDVLTVIDPETKSSVTLYFNIDPIWAAETKLFGK